MARGPGHAVPWSGVSVPTLEALALLSENRERGPRDGKACHALLGRVGVKVVSAVVNWARRGSVSHWACQGWAGSHGGGLIGRLMWATHWQTGWGWQGAAAHPELCWDPGGPGLWGSTA